MQGFHAALKIRNLRFRETPRGVSLRGHQARNGRIFRRIGATDNRHRDDRDWRSTCISKCGIRKGVAAKVVVGRRERKLGAVHRGCAVPGRGSDNHAGDCGTGNKGCQIHGRRRIQRDEHFECVSGGRERTHRDCDFTWRGCAAGTRGGVREAVFAKVAGRWRVRDDVARYGRLAVGWWGRNRDTVEETTDLGREVDRRRRIERNGDRAVCNARRWRRYDGERYCCWYRRSPRTGRGKGKCVATNIIGLWHIGNDVANDRNNGAIQGRCHDRDAAKKTGYLCRQIDMQRRIKHDIGRAIDHCRLRRCANSDKDGREPGRPTGARRLVRKTVGTQEASLG